jgi:O-acetyl-ADP-ribose deacetylase (regulator of RNase III)
MSHPHKNFELILVDVQEELCNAWKHAFQELPRVIIHHGKFQEVLQFDCMVSPANSFGKMDGGIDLAIRSFFGKQLQKTVQEVIENEFYGEQPVGTSIIVSTGQKEHPFLAHTPTMRVPKDISNSDSVYNATFAMLCAIANHNKRNLTKINKVLCPGLGTATGKVTPREAARQMALAYKNFLGSSSADNWQSLIRRDMEIEDYN